MTINVIRSNVDGIDSILETIDALSRNLKSEAANHDLPEGSREQAREAIKHLGHVRDTLRDVRVCIEKMRPPKVSKPASVRYEQERITTRQ